jgi:hypothetical protein
VLPHGRSPCGPLGANGSNCLRELGETDMIENPGPVRHYFLYGGCVSRDAFSYLNSESRLSGYVARQSLISAMNAPAKFVKPQPLASSFQMRNLTGDIKSNLVPLLETAVPSPDAVVMDLLVERLGVARIRGGSYVTMSSELKRSKGLEAAKGLTRFIRFGTDEHFQLWCQAAQKFVSHLDRLKLKDKTIVIETPWATHTIDGEEIPPSFGLAPDEANRMYRRYFDFCEHTLKLRKHVIDPADTYSTHGHKWGVAPYHYVDSAYEGLSKVMKSIAS